MSALSERVASGPDLADAARRLEAGGHDALKHHSLNPARSRRIMSSVREVLVADQFLLDPRGIAMAMRYTVPDISSRARVVENRVSTLIVAGTREAAFVEPCAFAEAEMPFVSVERVENAGHSPNAETPAQFNQAVTRYFRELLQA